MHKKDLADTDEGHSERVFFFFALGELRAKVDTGNLNKCIYNDCSEKSPK